jgi:hypothetical protein
LKRVLLDEGLPRPIVRVLTDIPIVTVQDAGWAGKHNGELLGLAQEQFDVLLTSDRRLRFQQNLKKFSIGVVVVAARSTKVEDILPLVPQIRSAIEAVGFGECVEVVSE